MTLLLLTFIVFTIIRASGTTSGIHEEKPRVEEGSPPVQHPPQNLIPQYTLEGQIPLEYFYVDDTDRGKGTHYKYSMSQIHQLVQAVGIHFKKIAKVAMDLTAKGKNPDLTLKRLRKGIV